MKFVKLFLISIYLSFFFGCEKKELENQIVVLQDEVDELESALDNLQGENKNLKGRLDEIKKLERELKLLRAKMDSVAQLPGTLYSQAHDYFELENYDACMNLLVVLSEKYPDWDRKKVEKKYSDANRGKREFEKEQLRLKKVEERKQKRAAQMLDSIKNNVESVFDSKSGKTYYRTLRSTLCQVAHTISFGIELYLVVHKDGNREFRIRSTYVDKSGSDYHDPQWMNYNEIELLTDNNKRIYVNVDREEMPEIDHLYMSVCQAMTGRGGWPLTVAMSPKKEPFFAGTYFPKTGRGNQPGMMELIPSLINAWNNKQDDIQKTIKQVNEYLINSNASAPGSKLNNNTLDNAYYDFKERFDNEFGGFGSAPKFPSPHNLIFLLRYYKIFDKKNALEMVTTTLDKMRLGGIFDHIGYGFHRYSTDKSWFLPHFEKMLYDQAMISMAYLEAFEATKDEKYVAIVEEIFSYVIRDMLNEDGGFFSAEDADSEGEEGTFYIWEFEEIINILGQSKGKEFCDVFGIKKGGNFLDEATGQLMPKNIPHLKQNLLEYASINSLDITSLQKSIESSKHILFSERKKRIHPLKDDKILTDWNGLMIASMARAGRVLDKQNYIGTAKRSAEFILNNLTDKGRLLKRFRNGKSGIQPHIDDYSFFVWGLIELYEATYEIRFLEKAVELSNIMIEDFLDNNNGGFFIGPKDGEKLIVRAKDSYDGAIPSGNAVAALNFIRLSKFTGNSNWEEIAFNIFKAFSNKINQVPSAHTFMLTANMFGTESPKEVVIVANEKYLEIKSNILELQKSYNPHTVYLFKSMKEQSKLNQIAPWTETHIPIDDKLTFYICENFACKMPTVDINTAKKYLK